MILTDPHGFVKVAAAVPAVCIADPEQNLRNITSMLGSEQLRDAKIIVFPELSLTGYTPADLFFQKTLVDSAMDCLLRLRDFLKNDERTVVVGLPVRIDGRLFNCAALISAGRIAGFVPKTNIPNYQEFYEKRWFAPAYELKSKSITVENDEIPVGNDLIFACGDVKIGIEICEDLWVPVPPSSHLAQNGANIILNLSATDENIGKYAYLRSLISSQSARCRCAYVYSSAGMGESSTDLVFSGNAIVASNGKIQSASSRFECKEQVAKAEIDIEKLIADRIKYSSFHGQVNQDEIRTVKIGNWSQEDLNLTEIAKLPLDSFVDPYPFIPASENLLNENCAEIINIQTWGLIQRLDSIHCDRLVVGISGGLDSTLALLIAHEAFRKSGRNLKNIFGVTMPGKATSSRTYNNAVRLMEELGVTVLEIPINKAVNQHFEDIQHDPSIHNAVYENSQARERTQILMDLANKENAIVLGTGDLSELALGWCTYNGDHMSMYNVNCGVPKTLVKYLVAWFADTTKSKIIAETLRDIIATPISPELVPGENAEGIVQLTEDLVGPYELHDFYLYHVLRNGFSPAKIFRMALKAFEGKYDPKTIKKWLTVFYRRFFNQQFKRSCMPDGPKVGSVCLSPRGDWRMPSDACSKLWLQECENLPDTI